jgi:hypothetical protein
MIISEKIQSKCEKLKISLDRYTQESVALLSLGLPE